MHARRLAGRSMQPQMSTQVATAPFGVALKWEGGRSDCQRVCREAHKRFAA